MSIADSRLQLPFRETKERRFVTAVLMGGRIKPPLLGRDAALRRPQRIAMDRHVNLVGAFHRSAPTSSSFHKPPPAVTNRLSLIAIVTASASPKTLSDRSPDQSIAQRFLRLRLCLWLVQAGQCSSRV